MPKSTDLPDDLKELVYRNALQIGDTHFDDDCRRLTEAIEEVLEEKAAELAPQEKERLEHESRAQPLPVTSSGKSKEDEPPDEMPKPVYPPAPKPAEPEREKPQPRRGRNRRKESLEAANRYFGDRGSPGGRWIHLPR